jgi:DNA adenine methylase
MLSTTTDRVGYLEPFMGACSVLTAMAPHFSAPAAGDVHPDLVMMWQAMQRGWAPPQEMTRERYAWLRNQGPSPERAFAGFGCSFSGRWFGGLDATPGRARRGSKTAAVICASALERKRPALTSVFIVQADYRKWNPGPGVVVYCDPPYAGTTGYGTGGWDVDQFWVTARQWAANGATVFVSEYSAPDDVECVWLAGHRVTAGSDMYRRSVERLFRL